MSEENTAKPKRNAFSHFLVPDETITLKVIFDNVKNYALCTAIIAVAFAVWHSASDDPLLPIHQFNIAGIALILVLLSILQSIEIWMIACVNLGVRVRRNGGPEKSTFKGFVRRAVIKVIIVIIMIPMVLSLMYGVSIGLSVTIMGFQTYTSSLESKPAQ